MKDFDVSPLQLDNARPNFTDSDIKLNYIAYGKKNYTEKLKHHLKKASVIIQKAALYVTFLYIPIYGLLLYFKVTAFLSVSSIGCSIAYLLTITTFVLINREEHTIIK